MAGEYSLRTLSGSPSALAFFFHQLASCLHAYYCTLLLHARMLVLASVLFLFKKKVSGIDFLFCDTSWFSFVGLHSFCFMLISGLFPGSSVHFIIP